MSKYERLARMLKIITLVKANPRMKRSDLARLCEVDSVRTIQRDINSLCMAGIPIYWSGEGYEIMPNFFLPPLAMSIDEAFSLLLSAKAYCEGEGEFHKNTIESAMAKIIATMPESARKLFELSEKKISIESRKASDIGGMLGKLHNAVLETKQLKINYYSYSRNAISERVIDPYALAFRKRAWYLIAYCHERKNIRTFRVNRIRDASYTGKLFSPPENFSVDEYMGKSWNIIKGEEVEVVVKFDAEIAPLIKEVSWHPTQQIEELPDGSILFKAIVAGTKEIGIWILSYGYHAEVLHPQSLRDEIKSIADKMCKLYSEQTVSS
ncbi:MAG: helix-turn-helix transcriptional regulator [bacterium]